MSDHFYSHLSWVPFFQVERENIRIDCSSPDNSSNGVIILDGIGETFQVDTPNALCSPISICLVGEGMTGRSARQHAGLHRPEMLFRRLNQVRTRHNGTVTLTILKGSAGYMQAVQRR